MRSRTPSTSFPDYGHRGLALDVLPDPEALPARLGDFEGGNVGRGEPAAVEGRHLLGSLPPDLT
ncbi:hypothetical protein PG997_006861 [Apiospora hydei]|uniref:Uncharacterized protein n=1 Tax=Apiospora hydei TaxID=1337664 RepID=A0ABR1WPX3_9PEZI